MKAHLLKLEQETGEMKGIVESWTHSRAHTHTHCADAYYYSSTYYSSNAAKQPKIHSATQARMAASPFSRADCASALSACTMATKKLPKQMEPKLVVMVRMKLLFTAEVQQPHSSGAYHHVPTVPAVTT